MKDKSKSVENWFEHFGDWVIKYRLWIISGWLVITVTAGLGLPKVRIESSIKNWFIEKSEVNRNRKEFEQNFNNPDRVALLITADDAFSPEILKMIDGLGEELEKEVPFADEVVSLANVEYSYAKGDSIIIEDLVPDPASTEPKEIEKIRRKALSERSIAGRFVSRDSKETWVVLRLLPFPENWKREHQEAPDKMVGEKVLEILNKKRYQKYDIKPTGTPVVAVEELNFTNKETTRLISIAFIIAIIILLVLLRSASGIAIPLLSMVSSIVIVYGSMGHLGIGINGFLVSIPVFLAIALSIGYSIHIFNYFKREFVITDDRKKAIIAAVRDAGWPILFTALTTIAALLSFCVVDLIPLRWLGFASASLVLVVYLAVIILTPAFLSFGKKQSVKTGASNDKSLWTDKYFAKFGQWTLRSSVPIIIVFAVSVAVLIYGLTKFEVNLDAERTYGRQVGYMNRMLEVAESKVGSFSSYNLTLEFDSPEILKSPETLRKVEVFISNIEKLELTRRVNSILGILKDMNQLLHEGDPDYYRIPDSEKMVAQFLLLYEMSGGENLNEWISYNERILRIQAETKDLNARETLRELDYLKRTAARMFPDAELNISGSMLEFAVLNQLITKGQINSFLIALGVIAILIMIVFRSVKTGLIGLIPNIAPVIMIGGIMGFFNIPLDFVTMTIIPMVLGIAVDDTIHFITYLHREYQENEDYYRSALNTLKIVGPALFMTTFVVIVSFGVFATSKANMLRNLGIFLSLGLTTALVVDYLMTPVLMNWFKPFKLKGKDQ